MSSESGDRVKKRVIYSDLDGTLLNYDSVKGSYFSEVNKYAVNKWIDNNNYFAVATGRNITGITRFIEKYKIPFNLPLVLMNGAVIYDYNEKIILYNEIFNKEFIDEVIEYILKEDKGQLVLISPTDHYVLKSESSKHKKPPFYFNLVEKEEIKYSLITKISILVSKETQNKVLEDLSKLKSYNEIKVIPSSPTYIEVVNEGTSKFEGIKKSLEHANISNHLIYTVGDYLNDVEMLKKADKSFAPKNAHEKVLSIVDTILPHHNEGAVSKMIDILLSED